MDPGESGTPPPHARALVEPRAFPSALSHPSQFDRILHAETGLCVSHHRYAGAEFRVDGFSHHCITIQLAGRTRHWRQVGEHRGDGTSIVGNFFATVAGLPIDWRWDRPSEVVNAWIAPDRLRASLDAVGTRMARSRWWTASVPTIPCSPRSGWPSAIRLSSPFPSPRC